MVFEVFRLSYTDNDGEKKKKKNIYIAREQSKAARITLCLLLSIPPIFHHKPRSRWVTTWGKKETNNMKLT